MEWNWQHLNWPDFRFDAQALQPLESKFLQGSGFLTGTVRHLNDSDHEQLTIELISDEALKTSEIEGEHLDRESLQSSIRKAFGLQFDESRRIPAAERGITAMMVDLYRNFDQPLSHQTLFRWHRHLLAARKDLSDIGRYRTSGETLQIVSGAVHAPKVHFEAPPSTQVPHEMERFLNWYRSSRQTSPLIRSAIAHLYFLAIHPFIDGNGRIARALSEKLLAETVGQPTLFALAQTIERDRKNYYQALHATNRSLNIDPWLEYFARTVIRAQATSLQKAEWLIAKAKLFDRLDRQLNPRQEKVLRRLFSAGPDGFKGGLSAENYIALTKTSRATATRDLQDLVAKGALRRTGQLKHTRYWLQP